MTQNRFLSGDSKLNSKSEVKGVMGAKTIQKKRVSPKNQRNRGNLLKPLLSGVLLTFFMLFVAPAFAQPPNDQCGGAQTLTCGPTVSGTVNGATAKPFITGMSKYGVWYTFVGDGNQTTITAVAGDLFFRFRIYTGPCTSLTQIYESPSTGYLGSTTYTFTTTSGTTYFVYIAEFNGGAITTGGNFTIEKSSTCCTWSIGDPGYNSNVIAKLCDNTLTISGNGNMCDFWHSAEGEAPWWFNAVHRNAIESVIIEDSVKNIGERAFKDCSNLRTITIPCSVIKINAHAFWNCSSLEEIHIPCCNTNPPIIGIDCFSGVNLITCELYIPSCDCANEYVTDWGWLLSNIYAEGSTQPCNATGIVDICSTQLQIFPNPAQNEIFIKSELKIEKIEIYSTLGRLMILESNFKEKISVSDLPMGVYTLKVYTNEGVIVSKVVKE